jgi:inward rectifier potassium channel
MKKPAPITVTAGKMEFVKLNAERREWRDAYHWILSLTWPRFALFIVGVFTALNLIFATAYRLGGPCIAEMPPDSYLSAFFFSAETLATVGYGHMYPQTTYAHVVVTVELMTGMFWAAVITGLIFVRFSRPTARILFSDRIVVAPFDGVPTLMLRVANLRHQSLAQAKFRLSFHRDEPTREGDTMRRFYDLKLNVSDMIIFPAALVLRHRIDETSPLHGQTAETLKAADARFVSSVVCTDSVINASLQSHQGYLVSDVHFGRRFVEVYTETEDGKLLVDYGRLHETEPV